MAAEIEEASLAALWRWLVDCGEEWARLLGFEGIEPPSPPPVPETLVPFRVRATAIIADGLGEYYEWVRRLGDRFDDEPMALAALLLRGLMITADHSGSAHAPTFQPAPLPPADRWLAELEAEWGSVHPHQKACATAQGSILLVAPTGSGKTESAMLWAARQAAQARHPAPRLFYVLPYQASMNAMRDRLAGYFGEERVALQHGKARHTLYRRYLERLQSPRQAAWAAGAEQDLVRLHLPPVRVLSPWQLLKAFYRLRGYEGVLAELHGGLFVCDEIHAYEVKRLALILAMIGHLSREFGAHFCLMSATFPAFLRRWLAEEIQPLGEVNAAPSTELAFRRHRVHLLPGDLREEAALSQIVARANEGLSVLVCCNTVARAQAVAECLQGKGLSPELLHARFNAADRARKERLLQERMGTRMADTDRRVVMVATQVVEVSLDIDFDVLFTDPAPLDALLQRLGRLNRGRKAPLRDAYVFSEPIEDQRPYAAALLQGALAVLDREFGRGGAILDEGRVTGWLNEVYTGGLAEEWEGTYRRTKREFEAAIVGTLHPFQASRELEEQFYRAFDGVEVLPVSMREEYVARMQIHPLAASELLVPIRWAQLGRLYGEGRAARSAELDDIFVVNCAYSGATGLEI
jgi:CRISPR-associated endonuclease/helicase Cas3